MLFKIIKKSNFWVFIMACAVIFSTSLYASRSVHVITLDNRPITPVSLKYIEDAIERAEQETARCLIIELDTPGGLLSATEAINKRILAAKVPVIVYVTPSGGRAASAGVFISYAAHVVAMAPSTNIGAAHPVMGAPMPGGANQDSSGVMMEKVINDAVAHIKGLAEQRGRNAEWAENAVRQSVSITASEAVAIGVADFIAVNIAEVLEKADAREIVIDGESHTLRIQTAAIEYFPMNWRYKILDQIANPNIAFLLVLLGFGGIYFELRSPGGIFPGAIGVFSLILAGFAFQVLPINTVGILLIILAIVFFVMETFTPSFGLLTIGGVIAMSFGAMMLYESPDLQVSTSVWVPAVIAIAAFMLFAGYLVARTHTRRVTTGDKGLVGEKGLVVRPLSPEGQVAVHGEIWRAIAEENLEKGQQVVVTAVEGLKIHVKKI